MKLQPQTMYLINQINQKCIPENAISALQDSRIEPLARYLVSMNGEGGDHLSVGEFSLDPSRASNNTWHSSVIEGRCFYPVWLDYISAAIDLVKIASSPDITIWHELGFTLQADHQIDGYMSRCPCYSKSQQFLVSPDLAHWNCFTCGKEGGCDELRQLIKDIEKNPDWEGLSQSDRDKLKLQMQLTQKFFEVEGSPSRAQCIELAEIAVSAMREEKNEPS